MASLAFSFRQKKEKLHDSNLIEKGEKRTFSLKKCKKCEKKFRQVLPKELQQNFFQGRILTSLFPNTKVLL